VDIVTPEPEHPGAAAEEPEIHGRAQTTCDAFLGGALQVLQPKAGYRAGLDAVLLAASCRPIDATTFRVLDCGAGVGVVGLCLAQRLANAHVTLVEIQDDLARLAAQNISANGFEHRMTVVRADLSARLSLIPELAAQVETYDALVANPPYSDVAAGTLPRDPSRAAAHTMALGGLEGWARFMAAMAKPGGTMTLVHRADALTEILHVFQPRFGAIKVKPIHARSNEPANRILVQGIKGSRAPLEIMPPLILYDRAHVATTEVDAILRSGQTLKWCD
jgi:tRNA1(Val) A37 N6-methylase TrmN6